MFFPASHGDDVVLDPDNLNFKIGESSTSNLISRDDSMSRNPYNTSQFTSTNQTEIKGPRYLEKPTILMCNPNALIY